ncbi:hypothetical protein AOCH_005707 [Aspergillus ochraceoroseus]|nr:hypothetical protein AOCH_005707 [Aspergillus ochraceoroseus]
MPTGISTIAGTEAQVQQSGCINPSSLWSCALPKEEQAANAPYAGNQPNFRVEIRFKNGTYDHSTAVVSRSLEVLASRSTDELFNPSPSPPSVAEQTFLGNATDGNSVPYAGEETPFYITIISPVSSGRLSRRSSSNPFPDIASLIPSPSTNLDGTAAAATLYPLPSSQPVRLYNRGEDNEHYGFYNYFDKSIFLSSTTPLTGHQDTTANDTDGGSTEADARVRCTWAQTRFLVQIWTKPDKVGKQLLPAPSTTSSARATSTSTTQATSSSSATDFTRPGSFPYPVTITLDRHGGTASKKMVYCYGMESDQHINSTEKKFQIENRGFDGTLINPAPGIFNLSSWESLSSESSDSGGYDGGRGGCACEWVNWISAV